METTILKFIRAIFVAILGLLGFAACGDDPGLGLCAYGSPTADYKYMGTVTDEEGNPIAIETDVIMMLEAIQLDFETLDGDYVLKTDTYGRLTEFSQSFIL